MMERWRDICLCPPGQVRRGKAVVRLSPLKWRILRQLLAACGSEVSTGRLMETVYGNFDPPLDPTLNVHIWKIRQRVAPLQLGIVKRVGFGWRVVDALEQ